MRSRAPPIAIVRSHASFRHENGNGRLRMHAELYPVIRNSSLIFYDIILR